MRKYVLPAGLGLVLMFSVLLIAATPMQYRTGIKADLLDTDTLKVNHNAILRGRVVSAPAEYSGAVQVYDSLIYEVTINYTSTDTLTAGHEEKVCMDCVLYEWSEFLTLVQDNRGWDVDTVAFSGGLPRCGDIVRNWGSENFFCSGTEPTAPPPSDTLFVYFKGGSCGSPVSDSFAAVWDSTALELTPVCDSGWRWVAAGGNCIDVHRELIRVWRDDYGTTAATIINETIGVCPSE